MTPHGQRGRDERARARGQGKGCCYFELHGDGNVAWLRPAA